MVEMKIPLLDLAAQFEPIADEVMARLEQVVRSRQFILGPEVAELEAELARYSGVPFAIGVASGTDALILGLKALGVGPGDEVITTPFTFYSTASSVVLVGAKPVFVDIEPDTCLINAELLESAVTARTKAILPVHLFGQCADMTKIRELAERRHLSILEDACQAIGAGFEGKRAGALGDAAALSFYPSKNLGGMGDGGMALTVREDVAEKVRLLRVHGAKTQYHHQTIGYNSRLDSLQAAALRAKLPYLEEWAEGRRRHAERYNRRFAGSAVKPLTLRSGRVHVYNNFVIRVPRRDQLMQHLKNRGIGSAVYYPEALHQMPCFAPYLPAAPSFPAAEQAARECLAIPVYPEMSEAMVDEVAGNILAFYSPAS